MSIIYFPSCKFTAQFPQTGKKIANYLKDNHGAQIAGCCKAHLNKIAATDTVVYICNTCAAFVNESTAAKNVLSVWELLLKDSEFPFPAYSHRKVTLQDCWRTYDNRAQQEAVREILRKMNIELVELADNYDKTRFCGCSLYEPLPDHYDELAPKRLVAEAEGFFQTHSAQEKEMLMKQHCSKIETAETVCYCVACVNGIILGGKQGIHLAEMIFGK